MLWERLEDANPFMAMWKNVYEIRKMEIVLTDIQGACFEVWRNVCEGLFLVRLLGCSNRLAHLFDCFWVDIEEWGWGQTVNRRWLWLVNSTLVSQRGLSCFKLGQMSSKCN
jgi:hypothetical protein